MKYPADESVLYLDNAATTFPKPPSVIYESVKCMARYCGNPGRGSHALARAASEKLFEVREKLCEMFHAASPENVVFTLNTTYAVNIALKAVCSEGDHILISDMEHNSVLRPVVSLSEKRGAAFDTFTSVGDEKSITDDIKRKIRKNTRILICQHASNICGNVLPIEKIGLLCKKRGIFFIVDAAQSAGLYEIDVGKMNITALCVPSHKALYGPQGAAAVIFSGAVPDSLKTLVEGGSGINSKDIHMPSELPDRLEAGTMPTPAVAGLSAGIDFVAGRESELLRHEKYLSRILCEELSRDGRITLYLPERIGSVVLFNLRGASSVSVSEELDRLGICTRAGLHCAPLAHRTLKTGDGGAVRVSFGAFNDIRDVRRLIDGIYSVERYL